MAFDMAFDFRGTAGFVTDPAFGVATLGETFPHTYTNGNGDSINAGAVSAFEGCNDIAAGNDPRIAGYMFRLNISGVPTVWQVDLSSGSAPGAGQYSVDIALGSPTQSFPMTLLLKDTASTVLDLTNGGSGYQFGAGHFVDATTADITASTNWTGTPVSITFSTTTVNVELGPVLGLGGYSTLAHFRLTLQGGGAVGWGPLLAGRRNRAILN